jgi:hypothetical protein
VAQRFSGGKLVGTTTSLKGAITNNAQIEFDQATNGTYLGNMDGTGSLTKSGAGKLVTTAATAPTRERRQLPKVC